MKIRLKNTTMIYCPFCQSPLVNHDTPKLREIRHFHRETYGVRCKTCGATGRVEELWEKGE